MKHHHVALILIVGLVAGFAISVLWLRHVHAPEIRLPQPVSALNTASLPVDVVVTSTYEMPSAPDVPQVQIARAPYNQFIEQAELSKQTDSSTVSLQFFGDIMLDRNVAKVMGASGTAYIFEHIIGEGAGLDPRIDLTIANNEGPYAPTRVKTSKSIAFRFDPKYATELKNAGFDAVSLANNHTLDMGWKNVGFTHQTLEAAGIGHFGDQLRESKDFTFVTTTNGQTIALVGFNNTDHIMDLKKISAVIADAKARASTTIVMMHWGEEYKRISNVNQRTFAHYLIDEGVDAVIGAHPHVVQEVEIYQGKPIFYSLGNFF
jgi:poly-gamma-glutamate synthesis protein (capsule biosynthesis protein)